MFAEIGETPPDLAESLSVPGGDDPRAVGESILFKEGAYGGAPLNVLPADPVSREFQDISALPGGNLVGLMTGMLPYLAYFGKRPFGLQELQGHGHGGN